MISDDYSDCILEEANQKENEPNNKFSLSSHNLRKRVRLVTMRGAIDENINFTNTGTKRKNTQTTSSTTKKSKISNPRAKQLMEKGKNKTGQNRNIAKISNILVPENSVGPSTSVNDRIKELELQIAALRTKILELDQQEVCDDSNRSPYVISARYQAKVVELCKKMYVLKGEDLFKRQTIRLISLNGHRPNLVKAFEEFLNNNIKVNGDIDIPQFPDIINCVEKANAADGVSWNKAQVKREAMMFFTHCTRALKARRQRRELRDLMDRGLIQKWDSDPANDDHNLSEQLKRNKELAMKKETATSKQFISLHSSSKDMASILNSTHEEIQMFFLESNSDESDSLDVDDYLH